MVIKKIDIGAFGKLEDYSIDLSSGGQVVYGPNEFGKSTLVEFLKMILIIMPMLIAVKILYNKMKTLYQQIQMVNMNVQHVIIDI